MDKYIELVGISQGISPDAISGVMAMLRNSVANDANYSNALGACTKENTKTPVPLRDQSQGRRRLEGSAWGEEDVR